MGKVDGPQLSSVSMQGGLLYLPINTYGFAVPPMLDTGTTWSFVIYKLAGKLAITQTMPATIYASYYTCQLLYIPATIKTTIPLSNIANGENIDYYIGYKIRHVNR